MLIRSLNRRLHASWLVAAACVGVVIGVAVAGYTDMSVFSTVAWALTAIALIAAGVIRSKIWAVGLVIIGGVVLGAWRGSVMSATTVGYDVYRSSDVRLIGTVKEDADSNKRGQTVLRLNDIVLNEHDVGGSVWVTIRHADTIRRSDRVSLSGKLSDGFGSFSASIYSAKLVSVERVDRGDIALEVRDFFAEGVRASLPDTEASLGLGYLVGQRRGLPEELNTALQAAGLTHIIVASGYNLTILVRLARRSLENVSKYLSFISSISMITAFIAITGMSPSMSRAGLVAGLSLVAWYYGRRFHPLVLLPFAMAITLLIQPSYAWGDLGWQLSFAAFAGVMVVAPLLQAYFFADKPERTLRRIFIETIAATIVTLPILLFSFGQFSVVAPVANMLILPLVPFAMLLTCIAGLAGLALPALAPMIGFPALLILTYMTSTAIFMGNIPWAVQELELTLLGVTISYIGIILCCVYMHRVTKLDIGRVSLVE